MATPSTVLWVDSLNNRLVHGWRGLVEARSPMFRRGDTVKLTIRWVIKPATAGSQMEEVPLQAGDDVSVYVGKRESQPYGGDWYITYGGEDSDLIPCNAPASLLQERMNRMATVSAAGGVNVSQMNGDVYKITFVRKGTRTAITASGLSLFPQSDAIIETLSAGSGSSYAITTLSLRQRPIATGGAFVAEAPAIAMVEELKSDIWDLYLTSDAKDGYFTITVDDGTPILVSVFEDPASLQAKLGAGYSVIRAGDFRWRIQSDSQEAFTLAIDSYSEIISFSGLVGTVDFDTQEAFEFLSGLRFSDAVIEIIRLNDFGVEMLVQAPCTVFNKVQQ